MLLGLKCNEPSLEDKTISANCTEHQLYCISCQPAQHNWLKMLLLLSFMLVFGLVGLDGLIPNNQASWDKNVFLLVGTWICTAYDHYRARRQEKLSQL
jgi:hypothetical protein